MAKTNKTQGEISEKKVTTKKDNTKNTTKIQNRKKKVKIDRNLEVVFMNNTNGGFFYKCPKTQNRYDMQEYGDTDYITIDELLTMRNSHRKILEDLWILLIDVNSDDVTLEDVLNYLGISEIYNDLVKPDKIDDFILKTGNKKFKALLNKVNKRLATKIVERAITLYKEDKFNSIVKARILQEFTGRDDLFD